jgi:hypothetical protein
MGEVVPWILLLAALAVGGYLLWLKLNDRPIPEAMKGLSIVFGLLAAVAMALRGHRSGVKPADDPGKRPDPPRIDETNDEKAKIILATTDQTSADAEAEVRDKTDDQIADDFSEKFGAGLKPPKGSP